MIGAAGMVLAALACTHEYAPADTDAGLQDLDMDALGVQRDLARHGDAARIAAQLVAIRRQLERVGERAQAPASMQVELPLALFARGDGTRPIERLFMSRPHRDRARASEGRTFPFSPAFLPLVDAGGVKPRSTTRSLADQPWLPVSRFLVALPPSGTCSSAPKICSLRPIALATACPHTRRCNSKEA